MYQVQVLADSVAPDGHRLTTFVVTFPRFILAEFNTHRMLSRNAASSRAMPISKVIQQVIDDPFVPEHWGTFKQGMVAGPPLTGDMAVHAAAAWKRAYISALAEATELESLRAHKSLVNRLLEPFMWATVVVSATEWDNFFHLRTAEDAQPEFRRIALQMLDAYSASTPNPIAPWEWHLPFIDVADRNAFSTLTLASISAARCARVSYLTHEGNRDTNKDIVLADRLQQDGHMSPFEHPAMCMTSPEPSNFRGWTQYRKMIPHESDPKGSRT